MKASGCARCPICQFVRAERITVMCSVCGRAYDRFERWHSDGTVAASLLWTAKRAIKFERLRARTAGQHPKRDEASQALASLSRQ